MVETVSVSSRSVLPSDSGKYLRFVFEGAKSALLNASSAFEKDQRIDISNRSMSGSLSIETTGITVNPPKNGSLVLEPGQTASIKFLAADQADLYGATAAPLSPAGALPVISDDNATFNDEGVSPAGWTPTNANITVSDSITRLTKSISGAGNASIAKDIVLPGSNRDFILYGKVRMSQGLNNAGAIWLRDAANTRQFAFWLNYNPVAGAAQQGSLGIEAYESSNVRTAQALTGVNTDVTWVEFALHYDHKWSTTNCFIKQIDGTWDLKARIATTFTAYTKIELITVGNAPLNAWIEFDYLSVCRPNIIVIGDSIAEGKTLYSPNRSLGLSNYASNWARYAALYPGLRNNLVVNKGVGSESSAATLSRIADATSNSPRVVFLHASSNDKAAAISLAARTTNIQNTIAAIGDVGATTVLLNAMYSTANYSGNVPTPDHRDYMAAWWSADRLAVAGSFVAVDIMAPIKDAAGFMRSDLTQSDGIHPTPSGYQLIGQYVAAQGYAR